MAGTVPLTMPLVIGIPIMILLVAASGLNTLPIDMRCIRAFDSVASSIVARRVENTLKLRGGRASSAAALC